ncbi:hypothetical protein Asi03nite_44530 [Actinoplanes siamensis]|uniref:Uncharacterized protein n=1 Tax=Actinoplanes siamensis TaxID=1223317 RepID=A0A919N9W2_9ACTN|nr:hypothetical protein Asi03nite_44530 [Actinoplanes siamensis]
MAAAARADVDRAELNLIDASRAAGVSWNQIGLVLGRPEDRVATAAQNRRRQLARSVTPTPRTDAGGAGALDASAIGQVTVGPQHHIAVSGATPAGWRGSLTAPEIPSQAHSPASTARHGVCQE